MSCTKCVNTSCVLYKNKSELKLNALKSEDHDKMKVRGRLNRTLSVTVPNNVTGSRHRQDDRHQRDFLFEFDHDNIPGGGGGANGGGLGAEMGDRPPRDAIVLTSSAQVPSPGGGATAEKRFSSSAVGGATVAYHGGGGTLPLPKLGLSSPWLNAGKPPYALHTYLRVYVCQAFEQFCANESKSISSSKGRQN